MKLDWKQDLNTLYKLCVFTADQKNKMATLASEWLRHFRLLLWNRWTEFNETWQEARSQCPLQSLCFSGWSEKQDGHPGLWLATTYFDFSLETAELNSTKLGRKQDHLKIYNVSVFRAENKIKRAILAIPPKKVAHCTQVPFMWLFGPLVIQILRMSGELMSGPSVRVHVPVRVGVWCVNKNFNLGHNFITGEDKAFTLHMCVVCDKTFHIVP